MPDSSAMLLTVGKETVMGQPGNKNRIPTTTVKPKKAKERQGKGKRARKGGKSRGKRA